MKKDSENNGLFKNLLMIQLILLVFNELGIISISWVVALLPLEIIFGFLCGLTIVGIVSFVVRFFKGVVFKNTKKAKEKTSEQKEIDLVKTKGEETKSNEKVNTKQNISIKEELLQLRESLVPQKEEPVKVKVLKK